MGLRRNRFGDRHAGAGAVGDRPGRVAQSRCWSGRPNVSEHQAISSSRRWRSPNPKAAATYGICAPRARRDGDDWIIDGHKMWIGNGGIANVHVVNAVVDEELGHRGQALFVVPGGTPGLELVRKLDKLGCRASHTAELRFDGVRVPGANLLGGQEKLEHKLAKAREVVAGGAAFRLGDVGHLRADPARWSPPRRSGSRARTGVRDGVCDRAGGVRRTDYRQPGHRVPAGGPGHPDRRGSAADLARLVDGGQQTCPSSGGRARCRSWPPARWP